ncbi:adherens junction formation factor afadin isoform X5 [Rhodnius prolixus]
MNQEMAMVVRRTEEREALRSVIAQWNANRLDLFELSEPNQDLEFHGVMRFYFQDSGQKVATKCIRVASDATAQVVIETLIEKFRPDMRMLSIPEYALYEIHENGDERRLEPEEKPLLVQLNWHKDDREGRFLLRRIDDKTNMPEGTFQEGGSSFRRKLSKREKKQLKKQEKLNRMKSSGGIANDENDAGVAEKLYTELPETSFTRSISNPEAVMRRRRQQKLERKLQQFRSKDGGPDTGGTLKIYGEALCKDVPYKTLLLSIGDTAAQVVKEMLMKYGLDKEEPQHYCLVQVNTGVEDPKENSHANNNTINNREYILDDDECPLAILMNHPMTRGSPLIGSIMFHVRRRPADYHPRKRKKKPQQGKWGQHNELLDYRYEDGMDRLPFFLELNPDGTEIAGGTAKRYRLQPNVTEVGSERGSPHGHGGQSLQLFGPNIQPRHCVIAHTEGIVTVTPCSRDAETYVNGQRIYETTILQNGATVKFGRIHNFRFLDPCHDERVRQRHDSSRSPHDYSYDRQSGRDETSSLSVGNGPTTTSTPSGNPLNYETTFDVDGNVETRSTSSQGNKDDTRSQRSVSSSREGNRLSNYERYARGNDPILPAVLEIREETEEALLHAIVTDLEPTAPGFKLAPAYTLYLFARYRASTHYRPELTPTERAHRLTLMLAKVAKMIHNVILERYCEVKCLALWLANASELLHFLKTDKHISAFSLDAQDTLADAVQLAFRHLVACLQGELSTVMPNFLSDRDDLSHDPEDSSTASVLGVLSSAMSLLRRCRVNAALTIQLFSQLFHFVNVWAFNKVVAPNSIYCSRSWGLRLKARLAQIEVWAEKQGLELAAECHLARLMQAAHLLQAPKYTCDDLATLSSTCFKLNSLQLRALLQRYQCTPDEPRIPHDIVDNVVRVAENLADELARSDGREVRLEEEPELALPFLLPEDGYSCEVVRGVPPGLVDFVAPLQHAGLCRLTAQPTSNGLWTVYMGPSISMVRSPSAMSNRSTGFVPTPQEPEVQIIKLHKSNNGMGLSIVAARGAGHDRSGIYIKSVVKGGAADADGRLQAGDQLLKVDGQSLVGISQEKAAEYLVRTGPIVTLEVAKQGAIYHGLATLLSQPSPVIGRATSSHLQTGLGKSLGGVPKSMSMGCCSERLASYSYPEDIEPQCYPTRPDSPTVLRISVPIITTTPPPPPNTIIQNIPPTNLLTVPVNNPNCYKLPPENNLRLHEDIFQEHQARLVNCDSEDASATLKRITPVVEKIDVIRYPKGDENEETTGPDWFSSSLERAKEQCPGRWVPLSTTKLWKSEIYLSSTGEWDFVDETKKSTAKSIRQRSKSVGNILETNLSSSSECSCNNNANSPRSTDSASDTGLKKVNKSLHIDSKELEINSNKLTSEERLQALKELDEIVSGISKITEFGNKNLLNPELNTVKLHPCVNEELTGNNFSNPCSSPSKQEKTPCDSSASSSAEGDFEYGSGRVAALAKHFTQLGEAGIIRGKGGKLKGLDGTRLERSVSKSEPNISTENEISPKPGDVILPPSAFTSENASFNLVLKTRGLSPVGFSMDRLIDIGHGVIIKEIKNDINVNRDDKTENAKKRDAKSNWTQTSPSKSDEEPSSCSQICETASKENLSMPTNSMFGSTKTTTHQIAECKTLRRTPMLSSNKKSISVDEVEMRRRALNSNLHKHYSLIELAEGEKLGLKENKEKSDEEQKSDKEENSVTNFRTSESIHRTYMGGNSVRSMKRWLSVDESFRTNGWSEKLKEKDKLDLGSTKDILRRKCKVDAIKGRKNRRAKKLELQRSFVVTPIKLSQMGKDVDCNTLWCRSLDPGGSESPERDESRPRRMSERDLPSRVHSEQQNQQGRGQHPPHVPQMHSSKSVPSLNTGNHDLERPMMNMNQTVIGTSTMPRPNHEVFNPGYSRTSSTNSIPQKSYEGQPPHNAHQIRSRSSQNLTDHRPNTLPGNHIGPRQPSNPNLIPNNYGGHQSPYGPPNQQPLSPYQQHHLTHPGNQQPYQHHQPPQHIHQLPSIQQQNSPVGDNGERFYQNLSIYRNQEVHNGYPPHHNGVGRGKLPSPQDERNPGAMQKSLRGSQSSLQSRSTESNANIARDRPASAYLPNNYHGQLPPQGMPGRSQSSRDMLRQEAKMQEMNEEVRRREMRVTSPQHRPPMGGIGSPIQGSPLRCVGNSSGSGPGSGYNDGGYLPPTSRMPQQSDYSESPPPPPPPPTSTHPLYQPALRLDSRYSASVGDPPRGSYYPASPGTQQSRQYYYVGSNPWQREEREREAERRRDVVRHWRDQQISELINLPQRNAQQEEHLRALKLEKEFERRAEEEVEEEEEEDQQETAERVQGLLRVAQQNDERRSMRTPQPNNQSAASQTLQIAASQVQNPQVNGTNTRSTISSSGPTYTHASSEEKARLQRLKDLKMKQAEVEAERLKKKQEEEMKNRSDMQPVSSYQAVTSRPTVNQSSASIRTTSNLRLDNLVINTPSTNNSSNYHNNNGYSTSQVSPPGQRLDQMVGGINAPQPPERGSSFAVMSQATQSQMTRTPTTSSPPTNTTTSTPSLGTAKRVSFQDPPPPPPPVNPAPPLDNISEDPNHFINEAENLLASPTSPDSTPFTGNTPGVIGAQEVYRDPRTKRLAEQQHQKLLSNKGSAVPEKLSFKEKMKMFAMETGEDATPKDKVKISRAQRDIDNIGSPTTPNNNTSAQGNS